jgi:hypothetical protein
MNTKKLSKSRQLAAKLIYAAFQVLKEHGGELLGKEVIKEVGNRVELDEWAKSRYNKSGYIRWESVLHFFTIDCIKAGFLIKKKGVWYSVSRFSKGQPPQCRDARPCVSTTDSTPFLEGVVMKVVHDQRGKRYI